MAHNVRVIWLANASIWLFFNYMVQFMQSRQNGTSFGLFAAKMTNFKPEFLNVNTP